MKRLVHSSARKEKPKKERGFFQRVKPLVAGVAAITISACAYYYCNNNFPFWKAGIYSYSSEKGMVSHWEKDGTVEAAWNISSLCRFLNLKNKRFINALENSNIIIYPNNGSLECAYYEPKTGQIHISAEDSEIVILHEVLHKAFDYLENKKEVKARLLKLYEISKLSFDEKIRIYGEDMKISLFLGAVFGIGDSLEWVNEEYSQEFFEEAFTSELFACFPTYIYFGIPEDFTDVYKPFLSDALLKEFTTTINLNYLEKEYNSEYHE